MEDSYRPSGRSYLHVNDDRALKIDGDYIAYLKALAQKDKNGRCTMCLHNDTRAHVHEMINVYPSGMYVRPHSHPFKSETKIMIEGRMKVIIFGKCGEIVNEIIMEREGIFTIRLAKGIIHTNLPLTDVVFHEVIEGPFVGQDDSVFPAWAPPLDDEKEISKFMYKVKMRCR